MLVVMKFKMSTWSQNGQNEEIMAWHVEFFPNSDDIVQKQVIEVGPIAHGDSR